MPRKAGAATMAAWHAGAPSSQNIAPDAQDTGMTSNGYRDRTHESRLWSLPSAQPRFSDRCSQILSFQKGELGRSARFPARTAQYQW